MPSKKGDGSKERAAARPADVVFGDKMQRAYEDGIGFLEKIAALSKHRALRYDTQGNLGKGLNRLIERFSEELAKCMVKPGAIPEDQPKATMKEFLAQP